MARIPFVGLLLFSNDERKAITKVGFIVTGDNFTQMQGTEKFSMKVVGVATASEGVEVAKEMGVFPHECRIKQKSIQPRWSIRL